MLCAIKAFCVGESFEMVVFIVVLLFGLVILLTNVVVVALFSKSEDCC